MIVCKEHLTRELALGPGVYAMLLGDLDQHCHVSGCTSMARYHWVPKVNQDDIPTLQDYEAYPGKKKH